ncbi:FAS1 domain-containing protein [Polychaeton citri CBS 116435]|uniref:FAS1 domain-containing protein n=1 Tax=Polychaeton citri CBS 116435 TaxID=1314669 RepID=A0A9P4QH77_9PEZI|nr:FAS1 domain-containing protein [Polychaeton citri CBS 116435]
MHSKTIFAAAIVAGFGYAQDTNLTVALASNQNLTALASLLQQYPDFTAQLANRTNVTIFAPSNNALQSMLQSNSTSATNVTDADIEALLNYHVLRDEYTSDNFTTQPTFAATWLNDTAYTNVTGGQVVELRQVNGSAIIYSGLGNNATVTTPDVTYDNGVVHIIDAVLTIPPTIDVIARGRLDDLYEALGAADLLSAVVDTPDVTIFAPNNNAFTAIGSALGNLSSDALADILTYHVTNQSIFYSTTLTGNDSVTMLDGVNATVTISDEGAICINQACVTVADVLIANGVAHVIDSVLNPNNTEAAPSTNDTAAVGFDGATSSSLTLPPPSGAPTSIASAGAGLTSEETNPAAGYTTTPTQAGENPAAATSSASDPAGRIAIPTGAVGAAALFGAGAYMAF